MNEIKGILEMESTRERISFVIGRPKDFGIGNPDGIPSPYATSSNEELQQVAEKDNEALDLPNDLTCTACIDGRKCLHNADGSEAKIRLRRVGGSAANTGVALNADSPVIQGIDLEQPIDVMLLVLIHLLGIVQLI